MKRALPLYAAAIYAFLHLPLLILAVFSFNSAKYTLWKGFSLQWYQAAFQDQQLAEAASNSLVIAVVATVLSTIIGTLCAYGLWKRDAKWLSGSLYLSLVTPEVVMGISLLAFFQWLFRYLHVQLGMHTVILAHNDAVVGLLDDRALAAGLGALRAVLLQVLQPLCGWPARSEARRELRCEARLRALRRRSRGKGSLRGRLPGRPVALVCP